MIDSTDSRGDDGSPLAWVEPPVGGLEAFRGRIARRRQRAGLAVALCVAALGYALLPGGEVPDAPPSSPAVVGQPAIDWRDVPLARLAAPAEDAVEVADARSVTISRKSGVQVVWVIPAS